jgi:hypothetical protein
MSISTRRIRPRAVSVVPTITVCAIDRIAVHADRDRLSTQPQRLR